MLVAVLAAIGFLLVGFGIGPSFVAVAVERPIREVRLLTAIGVVGFILLVVAFSVAARGRTRWCELPSAGGRRHHRETPDPMSRG